MLFIAFDYLVTIENRILPKLTENTRNIQKRIFTFAFNLPINTININLFIPYTLQPI